MLLRLARLVRVPMLGLVLMTGVGGLRCFAQQSTAQVSGLIRDPSGAAIAGAQVKMTQIETKLERQITSDDQGRYIVPALPVGPYQIEISAAGFKSYLQSGIVLQVGNNVDVNVAMQIGSNAELVNVEAQANMVETRDNTISQVVDERRIVELPLNGRQATQLVLLTPGASYTPGCNFCGGDQLSTKNLAYSVSISVAGMQGNGVNYLLDGADNNDASTNVNLPIPFPDALQEFSVQTSGLPARYGYHPSAVVNAVTKSGTNEWHGSLFEFLRNGNLNARNFFAPVHDNLKRNQFGGTFGGRIIRDKLFFFAGFQATYNRQSQNAVSFVPTPEVLSGDFSTILSTGCVSGGRPITILDPTTGQAFPGSRIPVGRFDKASVSLMQYLPAAQNQCGKVTYGIPTSGDDDQGIIRGDWLKSSKHTIYARSFTGSYRNPSIYSGNILTSSQIGILNGWQSATLGDTYIISPNLLNSFHAVFTRRSSERVPADGLPNPGKLGIAMHAPIPNQFYAAVSNYFSAGCSACTPASLFVNSYHLADDIDLIRGKHQIGFGVNISRNQNNGVQSLTSNGLFTFNGQYGSGLAVGDSLAAYFLGAMNLFQTASPTVNKARQTILGFYFQDAIKLNPRLTINVGLRWDPQFPITEPRGATFSKAAFDAGRRSTVFTNAPAGLLFQGDEGIPKGFQFMPKAVFSPRLGIAWDPTGSGRQSIRVGGAILRNNQELWSSLNLPQNSPYSTQIMRPLAFQQGSTFSNPWGGYPGGNPYPQPSPIPQNFAFSPAVTYKTVPLNYQPMYVAQWNLSYQRQITPNWLATATYIGSKSTHINTVADVNPGVYIPGSTANINSRRKLNLQNPAQGQYYGTNLTIDLGGNSNYNGLLLSLQHRFGHGFTWLSNYTWSHCLSDVDAASSMGLVAFSQMNNRSADYGNCYFDLRHNFNTSVVMVSPSSGGLVGRVFGQWQLAPLVTLASGSPINVLSGTDISQTGSNLDRPNYVAGCNPYLSTGNPTDYLNRACFQVQAPGTFGNLGRNVLFGRGVFRIDFSLSRAFRITERITLTPRFEAFNAINHTNFGPPSLTLNSPTFGLITNVFASFNGGGGTIGTSTDPRILQFAMKLQF